jgi:CHAT domain-containing protein
LVLLREVDRPSQAPQPFIGFGNPLFGGRPGQQRSLSAINLLRTGAPVDRSVFRRIPPLPETAQELETMRRLLGGSPDAMYFSDKATVAAVKKASLDRFRVVAFATHAVAAGEFPGTAEPAILLAPGSPTDPSDDGLLRASDISRLRLDAEWVLLSACNTAASDGTPGADGLSGLAQSFIFAGARTLLVSHWAVSSEATVPLTTGTIERLISNARMPKAEALRLAMVEMASGRLHPSFAHPAAWAPFILVGDGWAVRNQSPLQ